MCTHLRGITAGLYDCGVFVPLCSLGVACPELTASDGGDVFLPLGGSLL